MAAEQLVGVHLVLTHEDLAVGIDQTSNEWRMAYALANEDYAQRRRLERQRRARAFRHALQERRAGTVRFLTLFTVLTLTAVVTTVAMFEALFIALG